jgi:hypothetical protein
MRLPFRRTSVPLAVVALLSAFSIVGPTPAAASPPLTATFNPNLLLPGSNSAAEPSIKTDRFGQSFVIGPTGSQCKAMRVSHYGSTGTFIGAPDHNLGGGDCDWAIGPQETGATDSNIAYSSLDNLANITVGKSSDGGNTFGTPNPAAAQVGGDDRMWMVPDPKLNTNHQDTVFLIYHDISVVDIEMSISTDGGQTYLQSGPIINASEVPQLQWQGLGAFAGNELGNIVARRDGSGHLTLYSIFQTPDSAGDNASQGAAMTTNFNRVYEAIGSVTDVNAPALPIITWHNYEIYHGPLGARYNRIFPVTAVDSVGRVYAFWSDGNQIDYKSNATGTTWSADVAPRHIPNPTGVNTAIMPWAEAGAGGIVDVVFYGASGGAGAQPNPQDDPNNVWNAYMAQTVDRGTTWGVFKASDHAIHKGPLCIDGLNCNLFGNRDRTLLDFFQVTIDPTNGAADIAYADDHAAPGSAVMYYTRQCTGTSATTGAALSNDCVAPPPPTPLPQGTTCPGPQVVDFVGDAPNNYPGGDGSNMDNLDIVSASFASDPSNLLVTLTVKSLHAPPPPNNFTSALWTVYWTLGATTYFAQVTNQSPNPVPNFRYSDGTFSGNSFTTNHTDAGIVNGNSFVITVPRANVGGVTDGAILTNLYADTHGSINAVALTLYFTAAADRAPDSGYGANYVVGQVCNGTSQVPASLTLAPKTQTHTTGTQACVTATANDASGKPVANVTVRFSVGGSVKTSGSATTNASGQATFCYTGPAKPGKDQIKAYADTNNNGVQDPGEPSDVASVTWVSPSPPPCHEGDGEGDVQGSNGGTAHVSSDEDSCEDRDQDQVQSHDPGANKDFQSTQVQSVQFDDLTHTVTIFGLGVTGGNPVSFVLVETASGANTPGTVTLSLSDGYELVGNLLNGSISLQ